MNWDGNERVGVGSLEKDCLAVQEHFSAYLDGALDGRVMGQLAAHLERCTVCREEFDTWRTMHTALSELRSAEVPQALQAQLRDTLASEMVRGTHLSPLCRFRAFWQRSLLPMGMRVGAGLSAAVVLVCTLSWLVGTVAPVQANDDRLANLNAPHYLYSVAPPEPIITTSAFVAVLVDAKVDAEGRVYDYEVIEGPKDPATLSRIEANLLESIFKPATVFGVPVRGHAVMTYTAVSVRG